MDQENMRGLCREIIGVQGIRNEARIDCGIEQDRTGKGIRNHEKEPTMKEVMEFLQEGKKIKAIKRLREITGMGLKESKDMVDIMEPHFPSRQVVNKEAIEDCIEIWKEKFGIVRDMPFGVASCSLCKMYHTEELRCEGCPIYAATGERECYGTPFSRAVKARDNFASRLAEEIGFLANLKY